ncbi:MBL fold metallo-hydrolase [Myroides marinus]|uniref:MBL fold metallo-hydrolase n=1 Tax=Myroides marinus TaxID=703342 RepID=UPI0007423035|nr:MBL fold metallo-hydrolase [Myroides marinus]KUF43425.1 MBL fold metallo-hydrolase [Myroides marinus]MDM1346148.1 MBL fold metallo-hydrolase [Myroides marinus]MDM1351135.1 MBL fold metallo-hydrolase [Myroides marinus]MDM1353402.1 MBL fold metallo-hydrolase [Myroides marinus]MDM1358349.1 MBL fold metallo-hydrolase [Myroides marinus]
MIKVVPLKEGDFYEDEVKNFLPIGDKVLTTEIQLAVQPFLIITDTHNTLLDVGLGYNEDGKYKIDELLAKEGLTPLDIDRILLSHLHKDHINGLVEETDRGYVCRYPNAKIYIQRREVAFAELSMDDVSFDYDILDEVLALPNIIWMNKDKGDIDEYFSYQVVGGHSPYMQVFWVKEDDQIIFYGADNLPKYNYLEYNMAFKSDYDGKLAMKWRTEWKIQAEAEHWTVLFYHDMEKTMYSCE